MILIMFAIYRYSTLAALIHIAHFHILPFNNLLYKGKSHVDKRNSKHSLMALSQKENLMFNKDDNTLM